MIEIYIADTTMLSDRNIFWHYMDRVDETRREKVWQCRNEEDKKRSLLAGYLIQVGMKDRIREESGLFADTVPLSLTYEYGENGKPYFRDYPDIRFSISHSGKYVVAVFDKEEIGIDIQIRKELRFNMAERFFSTEDIALLESLGGTDDLFCFYKMWTIKEAYMKLTGEGLRQGLESTVIEPDTADKRIGRIQKKSSDKGAYYRLCDTEIEQYSIAVCRGRMISDVRIKEVELVDEKLQIYGSSGLWS